MIKWLRQRIARLERRWISDHGERERHDEHVRGRLNQRDAPEEAVSAEHRIGDRRDPEAG